MSLIAALATPPVISTGTKTRMDMWLDTLNDTEREAVLGAVKDPAWRHVDLMAALAANGAPEISDTAFGSWRRKMGLKR